MKISMVLTPEEERLQKEPFEVGSSSLVSPFLFILIIQFFLHLFFFNMHRLSQKTMTAK